jgi:hypothetical protein
MDVFFMHCSYQTSGWFVLENHFEKRMHVKGDSIAETICPSRISRILFSLEFDS